MSVVDLHARLTDDWEDFNRWVRSSDSLIYIDGKVLIADNGPASLELSVGQRWLNHRDGSFYRVPAEGLQVRPHQAVVVETEQRLALPLNVFALVTGKGKYIFQGVFISSGKIDPGFNGKLKIGFHNGGETTISLMPGTPFCTTCFLELESTMAMPLRAYESQPASEAEFLPTSTRLGIWLRTNWAAIVPIVISTAAVVVSILKK